jgi:hypothetical protein
VYAFLNQGRFLKKPTWTRSGLAASTPKDQNQELTVASYASLLNAAGGLPLSIQENFSYFSPLIDHVIGE